MKRRRGVRRGIVSFITDAYEAQYLRAEVLGASLLLVVALFTASIALDRYIARGGSPYLAAVISAVLVELANEDRATASAGELAINPKLVAAAQAKANDMAEKGYFAHKTPEGYDSWHWFELVGYDYAYAGENLAMNFSESGDVEHAWMNSPTHRANILNEHYTEIGIATAVGMYQGRPTIFVAQMFGRPRPSSKVVLAPPISPEETEVPLIATPPGTASGSVLSGAVDPLDAITEPEQVDEDGDAAVAIVETLPLLDAEDVPWWARVAAAPQSTLRYAYYVIGLFILFALFFDMQLELRWHHMKHAMRAGVVLATMSMLFVVADFVFFAEPILASVASLF